MAKIIFTENDCTLSSTVGKYSKSKNRYVKTWTMYSPKTGTHSIDTFTAHPDRRVLSHWQGFLANQN